MLQREFLDRLKSSAIATKESVCKKRPADLRPFVVCQRGNDPIAVVTIHEHVRDTILGVASMAAAGFDADQVGIIFETYQELYDPEHPERSGLNPVTGEPYGPNGMADVALNHDGIARGWVSENVSILAGNRAGDIEMIQMPYKYVADRHLFWIEGMEHGAWSTIEHADNQAIGMMPNAVRRMMSMESAGQIFPGLDRDRQDTTTASALTHKGNAVLLYAESTDTRRVAHLQKYGKIRRV